MASNAKKKTTMAKLNRERALLQRRQEKQARKEARRQAAAEGDLPSSPSILGEAAADDVEVDTPGAVVQVPADVPPADVLSPAAGGPNGPGVPLAAAGDETPHA